MNNEVKKYIDSVKNPKNYQYITNEMIYERLMRLRVEFKHFNATDTELEAIAMAQLSSTYKQPESSNVTDFINLVLGNKVNRLVYVLVEESGKSLEIKSISNEICDEFIRTHEFVEMSHSIPRFRKL